MIISILAELTEVFKYEWATRALIASSLVGIMCGILGCFIILRNMALIGDALSHAILPGVVVGFIIAGHSVLAFFTGAVLAGLITAILITWIQRNVKAKDDAAIGIVFTVMFALGVMGISWVSRQEGVHLDMKDFLFGNVLGIANQDLWLTSLVTIYVIICVVFFYRYFFITTFQHILATTMGISVSTLHYFLMLLLSFAVVASLQSVGVILVIAMLIIPASTAYLLTSRLKIMIIISAFFGLLSTVAGLFIAIILETTPGPAMTVTAAGFYAIAVFLAPERGLLFKHLRLRSKKLNIAAEDLLKDILKLNETGQFSYNKLIAKSSLNKFSLNSKLEKLRKRGLITGNKYNIALTEKGTDAAKQLVRAHRLWETYMVKTLGFDKDQIHEQAEKYEHLLPETILNKVDEKLGFPKVDPHGSPIPQASKIMGISLTELKTNEKAVIISDQLQQANVVLLWRSGVIPETPFYYIGEKNGKILIELNKKTISIDKKIAEQIKVKLIDNESE
jgi:ABC-type Mn2+/Zn2+ transport system permease subunit/Mn-dependent DtxR family transcriptional regulator